MSNNTVTENAQAIYEAVEDIKDAVADKGVSVPEVCPIASLPQLIESIETGGEPFDLAAFFARTLTTLELSVATIGNYMFYSNTALQSFKDTALTSLGEYAFYGNTALTSFIAAALLTEIKAHTFEGCTNLVTLDLSHITQIGECGLYNCQKVANIGTLAINKIGDYGCYYLGSNASAAFKYQPTAGEVGSYGLQYAKISEVAGVIKNIGSYGLANLQSTFTKISAKIMGGIGTYGLANNQYVNDVDFSDSEISSLGTYAFYYFGWSRSNYSTDRMTLDFRKSKFAAVEQYAFCYTRYVDIYLPESVSQLNNYAFQGCTNINVFLTGKAPVLQGTNIFNSASSYKIYAPWKYLHSYMTGTNWTTFSSYIVSYAPANTFTAGDTLPEYNAEGYALTWYSDEQKTTPVTTCPSGSPALYCSVGSTKEKQVVSISRSGAISIAVTDSSSNPVDISLGYFLAENGDTFSVNASSSEQGYTYYIKVDGVKVTSFPYALSVGTDDISISGTAYDPSAVNPDFEEASWRELKTAIETGVATTLYANDIGKTKVVRLTNGQTIHLRLANNTSNLYDLADGSGSTGFVLEFVECLDTTYYMNPTATNEGGWNASYMRTTVMPLVKALLPAELQEVIATVKRKSVYSENSETLVTSEDELFLPFEREVSASRNYSRSEEWGVNTRWQYYAANDTNAARIKNRNGSATNWWLASASNGYTNNFCRVNGSGNASNNTANKSNGVPPALTL